jgi:hypothetical protein
MHINEGSFDRAMRLALGLGLLSLTVVGPQSLWGLVGLVPLVTGLVGYCPVYQLMGINTLRAALSGAGDPSRRKVE